jgi:uracil-DNA glycosylase
MSQIQIDESWRAVLSAEFEKPYFTELIQKVRAAYQEKPQQIFPKGAQIFRAFDACPFHQVKVVILGQDPYPTKGHAHGLCFSVEPNVRPLPKSLNNIFKELQADLGVPFPENGNLIAWAQQGVLLLNSVLTVEEGLPDSHKNFGWETFTDEVIAQINNLKNNVVFILWGAKAAQKASFIDNSKHLILKSVHPSPLSAHRGFFGCRHFSKTNAFLRMTQQQEIQW